MGIFICEKCGKLDNTALNNNYWLATMNKKRMKDGEEINAYFKPDFTYFNNHVCCSDCCDGLQFSDESGGLKKNERDIKDKEHWTKYGKEKLLEWEARNDGSMENATEYLIGIGEIK